MTTPKHHHSMVFKITGTNGFGAATGNLFLFRGTSLVLTSSAFSGGVSSPVASNPIPVETYRIHLEMRQVVDKFPFPNDIRDPDTGDVDEMHHWYGIEKIDVSQWQYEWGNFRAALNERDKTMPQQYRGNFLHGKKRADDYTHGCICERSEVILARLWHLQAQVVPLRVEK